MAEYAPDALLWLADEIVKAIPSAKMSGIVGDKNHVYGYHRSRNVLPADDYSVQTKPDKQGDGDAAAALDISLNAKWMKIITKRLMDSAKDQNDPRLNYMREFFGTLDGSTVSGWDTYYGRAVSSDDSHLWHVHMSLLRKYCTSKDHMAHILSVIKGEEDMELSDRVKVSDWIHNKWDDVDEDISVNTALGSSYGHARQAKDIVRAGIPDILAGQKQILEALQGGAAGASRVAESEKIVAAIVKALDEKLDDMSADDLEPIVKEAVEGAGAAE
ncbi:MAG TPA: hypothetical protein H9902_13910 [Candidatus Stackebrandtia faecavium]|nr:hypothetical protein [Candidatus Stackebrandtia faecavium]